MTKLSLDYPEWITKTCSKIVTSKYCEPDTIMYVHEPTPSQTIIYPTYPSTAATTQVINLDVSNWYNALAGGLASCAQQSGVQGLSSLGQQSAGANTYSGLAHQQSQYQYNYQYLNDSLNGWYNSLGSLYPSFGTIICQPPETAEQKVARLKLEAEREAKRKAASMRAEHLLFTILTPTQVKQYTDEDFIELIIKGRTYRVRKGYSRNIDLIEAGKPVARYCAHPKNAYDTPIPDSMLAQILMLQTNEAEFLKVANRTVLQ